MSFKVESAVENSVGITITDIAGDFASIDFSVLDGYQAVAHSNYAALFQAQGKNLIPWDSKPQAVSTAIGSLGPSIDFADIGLLMGTPYIIGYSLAPYNPDNPDNNFCASAYIEKVDDQSVASQIKATIGFKLEHLDEHGCWARFAFKLLSGYTPKAHKNWIGVWDADDDYTQDPPRGKIAISADDVNSSARVTFPIYAGHTYKAYYFFGGWVEENAVGKNDVNEKDLSKVDCPAAVVTFSASDV